MSYADGMRHAFLRVHRIAFQLGCLIGVLSLAAAERPVEDDFKVDQLTTHDGLPQNTIYPIAQTPDGYLWVGTWGGLARYDGEEVVTMNPDRVAGFLAGSVRAMTVTGDGRLWLSVGSTIGHVDATQARFQIEQGVNEPCEVLAAVGDEIVAGGEWGIAHGLPGRIRRAPHNFSVRDIAVSTHRQVWLASSAGVAVLRLTMAESHLEVVVPPSGAIGRIASRGDTVWASMGRNLFEIDAVTAQIRRQWAGADAEPLLVDRVGYLWVALGTVDGGRRGLGVLRPGADGIRPFNTRLVPPDETFIRGFEDASGTLWFGTKTSGVLRLRPVDVEVFDERHGLPSRDVWSISASPDGGLWVQTKAGAARRLNDRFEPIAWPSGEISHSILALSRNEALTATPTIQRLNPDGVSTEWVPPRPRPDFIVADRLRHWVAGGSGGVWARGTDGQWSPVVGLRSDSLWIGWEAGPDGEVFLGSLNRGLFHRPVGGAWEPLPLPGNPRAATVLGWEGGRRPWVGSTEGLYRQRDDGGWDRWTTRQGLAEDLVLAIQPDGHGNLWLLGHQGLARFSVAGLNAVVEGRDGRVRPRYAGGPDGLAGMEGNSGFPASACEADGTLWFATTRGAVRLDPRRIPALVAPRPIITEAHDLAAAPGSRPTSTLTSHAFVHGTGRALHLRFTAPFPSAGHEVHLEYRLEGIDAAWHAADRHREASYAGLKPGPYRFEVRAAVADGPWHPEVAQWSFEVRPLWWERTSVRIGAVIMASAIAVWLVLRRLRLQRQLAALHQARAVEDERRRLARDMHDGLGSELARIYLAAETGSVNMSEAARNLLERLQTLVWLTDPAEDRLDALVRVLASRIERFFPHDSPALRLELPTALPAQPIDGRWRRELLAWLDEGMANVAKHAGARQVRLRVDCMDGSLHLLLADDGRGFVPEHVGPGGHGLSNLQTRVTRLGGRLEIRSTPGAGTELEAWIPLRPLFAS